MYITREKFEEICKNHSSLLVLDSDVTEALEFVQELLEAEADALKEREPHATVSVKKLYDAAYQVYEIGGEVENEEFLEEDLTDNERGKVEFKADSHSLSALVDGEAVYEIDSLLDDVEDLDLEGLKSIVDECLDVVQAALRERNESVYVPDELEAVRDALVEYWGKHLGVIEENRVELPKCVSIPVNELELDEHILEDEEWLGDVIGDYLSNTYGYCHFGFQFHRAYDSETQELSEFVVTDIEWDIEQEQAIDELIENANGRVIESERSADEVELDL